MWAWNPKKESLLFGFFFFTAFGDGILRFFILNPSICNDGVAFGIAFPKPVLWMFVGLLLALSAWLGWKGLPDQGTLAWRVIFIGGFVNAIDRFVSGCVHDYIALPLFPSFNLADMMLFLGVVYLLGRILGIFPARKTYVS